MLIIQEVESSNVRLCATHEPSQLVQDTLVPYKCSLYFLSMALPPSTLLAVCWFFKSSTSLSSSIIFWFSFLNTQK